MSATTQHADRAHARTAVQVRANTYLPATQGLTFNVTKDSVAFPVGAAADDGAEATEGAGAGAAVDTPGPSAIAVTTRAITTERIMSATSGSENNLSVSLARLESLSLSRPNCYHASACCDQT